MISFRRSRIQRFWKRPAHCSIPKSDAHHSLESWRFPLGQYPAKRIQIQCEPVCTQILDPLSKWRRTQVGLTNRKLIVYADDARPHTAKMTSQFMEQNSMQRYHIQHTHQIWHPLISTSLAMLNNSCQVVNSQTMTSFFRRSATFWWALKR
jgi:hypothetical protein